MIWELINPSDPIAFETEDHELAALAVVLVGRGQYAAVAEANGKNVEVPMFSFQPEGEIDKWFSEHFNRKLKESLEVRENELPAVLRSFQIGKPMDLAAYNLSLEFVPLKDQPNFKKRWKEQRRSSMNDICGYAWQCADDIESKPTGTIPAPISVFT